MTKDQTHSHPNRHRKALRSALMLAGAGTLVLAIGLGFLWGGSDNGYLIALIVAGVTIILLSPVWYFTYMENLEPEIYQHD